MLSFKNVKVYLNNKKIVRTNLTIKDGKFLINKNTDGKTLPSRYIIVPGFIEQHIHGANGSDVMDATEHALSNIAKALVKDGTTSWCPTTMTMSKTAIRKALKVIAKKQHKPNEAKIIGVHLEGPFISKIKKGAHESRFILKPNNKDLDSFIKASDNKIRLITLDVAKCHTYFLRHLKARNITISVGHTMANAKEFLKAFKEGTTCSTHTFNAMQKTIDNKIGIVGQILKHKRMFAELILDLKHVLAKTALSLKDHNRLILVTDSNAGRYKKDGKYHLGCNTIYVKNGIARNNKGTLAGSVLTIPQALKNAKKIFNYSFERCIDLVCKNPANNLNLKDGGIIKNNASADFVIIDENFNIYQTYIDGKLVYSKK